MIKADVKSAFVLTRATECGRNVHSSPKVAIVYTRAWSWLPSTAYGFVTQQGKARMQADEKVLDIRLSYMSINT